MSISRESTLKCSHYDFVGTDFWKPTTANTDKLSSVVGMSVLSVE